ncbi:unnamed protein product, partial [Nesidiocoris tenuis]
MSLLTILPIASSLAPTASPASSPILLPNTTGIDGELLSKLGVDRFFSLWIVFNNEDVITS